MSPAMLTLVAAVEVYDRAAEGATDAFELLSSARVSRYAISWTSVEKDMVAVDVWVVGAGVVVLVVFTKRLGRGLQDRKGALV
jgi:hypothetical protein